MFKFNINNEYLFVCMHVIFETHTKKIIPCWSEIQMQPGVLYLYFLNLVT